MGYEFKIMKERIEKFEKKSDLSLEDVLTFMYEDICNDISNELNQDLDSMPIKDINKFVMGFNGLYNTLALIYDTKSMELSSEKIEKMPEFAEDVLKEFISDHEHIDGEIAKLERIIQETEQENKRYKSLLSQKKTKEQLKRDEESLLTKQQTELDEILKIEDTIFALNQDIETLQKQAKAYHENEILTTKEYNEAFAKCNAAKTDYEQQLENTEKAREEHDSYTSQIDALTEEEGRLTGEYDGLLGIINSLNQSIESIGKNIDQLQRDCETINENKKAARTAELAAEKEKARLNGELATIKTTLDEKNDDNAKLAQQLENEEQRVTELGEQYDVLNKQVQAKESEAEELEKKLNTANEDIKKFEEDIKKFNESIPDAENKLNEKTKERDRLQSQYDYLIASEKLQVFNCRTMIEAYEKEVAGLCKIVKGLVSDEDICSGWMNEKASDTPLSKGLENLSDSSKGLDNKLKDRIGELNELLKKLEG